MIIIYFYLIFIFNLLQSFGSRGSLDNTGSKASPPSSKIATPKTSVSSAPEPAVRDSPPSVSPATSVPPIFSGQRKSSGPTVSVDEHMALQKKVLKRYPAFVYA